MTLSHGLGCSTSTRGVNQDFARSRVYYTGARKLLRRRSTVCRGRRFNFHAQTVAGDGQRICARMDDAGSIVELKTGQTSGWKAVMKDILAGTAAGMTSKVIEYPFDTMKVRQQVEKGLRLSECIKVTYRDEGVNGFFRGLSAPLFGAMAENAIVFFLYEAAMREMEKRRAAASSSSNGARPMWEYAAAGVAAGVGVAFWLTPVELVKVRLQARASASLYTGPLDCIAKLYKEGGGRAFFNGHSFTLMRESIGGAFYFGGYNAAVRLITPAGKTKDDLHPVAIMACGAVGGGLYWTSIFPFDTAKSRIQGGGVLQGGMVTALSHIFKTEGIRGMYNGYAVTILRSMPSNAVIFGTYEVVARLLKDV